MINNSIALQRGTNPPQFFYGTNSDGKPASFITPQHGSKGDYYWPTKSFAYAGKAHPELTSAPDELLITYAANAWDFWDLFKDARLYWPRFVHVKMSLD